MRQLSRYASIILCMIAGFVHSSIAQGGKPLAGSRSLNFSTVNVGKTATKSLVIFNADTNRSVHMQVTNPLTSAYRLISSDTFTIAPRGIDTVWFEFKPMTTGLLLDSVYLTHDGDTTYLRSPSKVRLTGTGLPANDTSARIIYTNPQIFRAPVDSFATRRFFISNVTDTTRQLTGRVTGIAAPFSFVEGQETFDIAQHDTMWYTVKFTPTTTGTVYDTLTVTSNADSIHSKISIILVGQGLPKTNNVVDTPKVSFSTTQINFGTVVLGTKSSNPLVIRNISKDTSRLTGTVRAPRAPFVLGGTSLLSVKAGDSAVYNVAINPTAAGTFADSIVITTNSSEAKRMVVYLNANVTEPEKSVDDPSEETASIRMLSSSVGSIRLLVASPSENAIEVGLFSVEGKEFVKQLIHCAPGEQEVKISTGALTSGTYFLSAHGDGIMKTMKLIVLH